VDIQPVPIKEGEGRGLTRKGEMAGGRWLSSTTRHVRIYIGYIDPETHEMDQQQSDFVTIDVDPDNEFLWPQDKLQKVFDFFDDQIENYRVSHVKAKVLRGAAQGCQSQTSYSEAGSQPLHFQLLGALHAATGNLCGRNMDEIRLPVFACVAGNGLIISKFALLPRVRFWYGNIQMTLRKVELALCSSPAQTISA
jgi:hypothetical protein